MVPEEEWYRNAEVAEGILLLPPKVNFCKFTATVTLDVAGHPVTLDLDALTTR